jgi:signal transduction histidine kinase/CheY-like chemotaxis protein/HPt (histidine-containing phosphotransfer) domain-containing protein
MRKRFKHAKVKNKLIVLIFLTATPVLLFFSVATLLSQFYFQRDANIETLKSVVTVLADNTRSALLFSDQDSATKALSSLSALPDVMSAALYDAGDNNFAGYARKGLPQGPPSCPSFTGDSNYGAAVTVNDITVCMQIISDGEVLGRLLVTSELSTMKRNLLRSLYTLLTVLLASLLIVLSLSNQLQKIISAPLISLKVTMQKYGREQIFESLTGHDSKDEIGELYDVFNNMLVDLKVKNDQVEDYQAHLTELVEAKTHALSSANASLEMAIIDAEKSSQVKSEFIATMSHEIRTPLNGLLGMMALMSESEVTAAQQRQLEIMLLSGRELLHIVNEILDFSKMQADMLSLDPEEFGMAELVEQIGREFTHCCTIKLSIIVDYSAALRLRVTADRSRLRQVLHNLMSNAVKFTDEGEVVLRVTIEAESSGQIRLRFDIEDTGIGIPESKMEEVQKPFSQVDGSTSREYGGTGLGLSICTQLLMLMDSALKIESHPGLGSCFSFSLDFAVSRQLKNTRSDELPANCLVVCEQRSRAISLIRQLAYLGINCQSFDNVANAARVCEGFAEPMGVFLDFNLPGAEEFAVKISPAARIFSLAQPSQKPPRENYPSLSMPDLHPDLLAMVSHVGQKSPAVSRMSLNGRGLSVLVVDDGEVNRELIAGLLMNDEFDITMASDGYEAYDQFRAQHHDLVLMDCSMPKADGFAATQWIREHETRTQLSRTPVIAVTAHGWEIVEDRCRTAGMDDYLIKPFSPTQLRNVVLKWLNLTSELSQGNAAVSDATEDPEFDETVFTNILVAMPVKGSSLCVKLIDAYFSEAPQRIELLGMAVAADDLSSLTKTAHALRSSAANLGLRHMQICCKSIENQDHPSAADVSVELLVIAASAKVYLENKRRDFMAAIETVE